MSTRNADHRIVDAICAYTGVTVEARFFPRDSKDYPMGASAVATYPGGVVTRIGDLYEKEDGTWEFMADQMLQQYTALYGGDDPERDDIWERCERLWERELEGFSESVFHRLPDFTRQQLIEACICGNWIPESESADRMVTLAFSNCLELYLLERIFYPFRRSEFSQGMPKGSTDSSESRSLMHLNLFIAGQDEELSLGVMAHILKSLGTARLDGHQNGFRIFLANLLSDQSAFFKKHQIPRRILQFSRHYRNPAVHPAGSKEPNWLDALEELVRGPASILVVVESLLIEHDS